MLLTQVTIKHFENTVLTSAAPEFECKRIAVEKIHFLSDCVCASVSHIQQWGQGGGREEERGDLTETDRGWGKGRDGETGGAE